MSCYAIYNSMHRHSQTEIWNSGGPIKIRSCQIDERNIQLEASPFSFWYHHIGIRFSLSIGGCSPPPINPSPYDVIRECTLVSEGWMSVGAEHRHQGCPVGVLETRYTKMELLPPLLYHSRYNTWIMSHYANYMVRVWCKDYLLESWHRKMN